tara:strand:- start:127 stop:462 length:336 start_codon:yes stop_codon:yes gene_type:complete
MSDNRLPTDLWVSAGLRRASDESIPTAVVRRGERQSGTVILKLNQLDRGCRILTQARDIDGRLEWFPALDGAAIPEADADAYVARAIDRDPDIWVIEIEHREGWHPYEDVF